jgi:hypothetical protein
MAAWFCFSALGLAGSAGLSWLGCDCECVAPTRGMPAPPPCRAIMVFTDPSDWYR